MTDMRRSGCQPGRSIVGSLTSADHDVIGRAVAHPPRRGPLRWLATLNVTRCSGRWLESALPRRPTTSSPERSLRRLGRGSGRRRHHRGGLVTGAASPSLDGARTGADPLAISKLRERQDRRTRGHAVDRRVPRRGNHSLAARRRRVRRRFIGVAMLLWPGSTGRYFSWRLSPAPSPRSSERSTSPRRSCSAGRRRGARGPSSAACARPCSAWPCRRSS